MKAFDFKDTYRKYARKLERESHRSRTVSTSIDGDFEAMGYILFDLVRSCGLEADHSLVEVNCGSGRLTVQLSGFLEGKYLGLEADPKALTTAKELADRPDWRFEAPVDLSLSVADASVEMVTFLSVFTHTVHQESFLYLEEAFRALKPGGKAVMSFLEFEVGTHWPVFQSMVAQRKASKTTDYSTQFISRDALHAWADAIGFIVLDIWAGDQPFVPLSGPVTTFDGRVFEKEGTPGESVCVMQKPYED